MLEVLIVLMITLPQILFYTVYAVLISKSTLCKPVRCASRRNHAASFSFIIPVRKEPLEYLEKAVRHIHELGIQNYEVIIVSDDDEAVKDELFRKLTEWRSNGVNVWLAWRSIPRGYRTGALNVGLNLSTGDYVYVMDIDSRLDKCLLEESVELMESDPTIAAVVGRWEPLNFDSRLSEALGYSMKFVVDAIYRGRWCLGLSVFPLGTGTVFRSQYIKDVLKGWDEDRIQDDMEIGARIMYFGLKTGYLDGCAVYVENPSTYKALRVQQSRWAYGATDVFITRFKHIASSNQSILGKVEASVFLLQYAIPSLVFLGTLLLLPYALLDPKDILLNHAYLFIPLIAAQGVFGIKYYGRLKGSAGSGWRALVNMGRSTAVTTALSPYYAYSVIKALLRIRVSYARTPKGVYQFASSRMRVPWEVLFGALFTVGGLLYLVNGAIITGLWLLLNSLAYWYVVYRWPRDALFK